MKRTKILLSALLAMTAINPLYAQGDAREAVTSSRAGVEARMLSTPVPVTSFSICIVEIGYQTKLHVIGATVIGALPDGRSIKIVISDKVLTASLADSTATLSKNHQLHPSASLSPDENPKLLAVIEQAASERAPLRVSIGKELFSLAGVPILEVVNVVRDFGADAARCD